MSSTSPGSTSRTGQAPWLATPALVAATSTAGLLVVAAYAGGVLLPYFANDLHHLSYADLTSGAHDPKWLWPAGSGLPGALMHAAGFCAALIAWLVTAPAAMVSGFALRSALAQRAMTRVVLHVGILALLVSATVLRFTPLGAALATWYLD